MEQQGGWTDGGRLRSGRRRRRSCTGQVVRRYAGWRRQLLPGQPNGRQLYRSRLGDASTTSTTGFSTGERGNPAHLALLLLRAGDIETNPGPRRTYPCGNCGGNVSGSSLCCRVCLTWWHGRCARVLPCTISRMARTGEDWTCQRCEDQTRAAVSLAAAQSDTSEERQPPTTNPRRSRPGRRRRGARRRAAEGQRPTTDLRVLQWNADGARSKRTELEKLLEDLKPSIVAIQETKLRACDNFQVRGYNTIRKDRTRGRRDGPITGGGVATLVREGLTYRSMDQQTTTAKDETTDVSWWKSETGNANSKYSTYTYHQYGREPDVMTGPRILPQTTGQAILMSSSVVT